jgi:hypothetical protein
VPDANRRNKVKTRIQFPLRGVKSRLPEKMSFLRPACAFEVGKVLGTAGDCRAFGFFRLQTRKRGEENSILGI